MLVLYFICLLANQVYAHSLKNIHETNSVSYPLVNITIFTKNIPSKFAITKFDNKNIDRIGAIVEVIQNGSSYLFIADWGNSRIIKTDENGTFITSKTHKKPVGLTASTNFLYYTSAEQEFIQMDFDLNVKQTIKKGAFLQGIWFDIQTGFLYVADEGEPPITNPGFVYVYQVVNESKFILNSTITVKNSPYSVMVVSDQLYIGDENNDFLIYNKNSLVKLVTNLCNSLVEPQIWSILADINGNVVFPCSYANQLVVYINKTQTFANLVTDGAPRGVYLDSKSRLVIGTSTSLLIYY